MSRRTFVSKLAVETWRWVRHFGDFVSVPLAAAVFVGLAGMYRLPLVLFGIAVWTLAEYLVHRFAFHLPSMPQRLHQLHHDHPSDPDAERSSLSTPLLALPVGFLLIRGIGVQDGSAIFAGLLLGYLAFIFVHHAVHRWPIGPNSYLYPAKMRHLTHHRLDTVNYGVTTIFWDIVFGTDARIIGERLGSF